MPKFLSPEEWAQTDVGNYIGNYENAALSIVVDLAANKSLRVRVYSKQARSQGSSEPYVKRYLRPAADSVFFSTPPEPLVVPFVQFLDPTNAGKYRYIQNGRMLFARQG
jgi:hypothetical protein